jgi:SAM-dependent methyltransferase
MDLAEKEEQEIEVWKCHQGELNLPTMLHKMTEAQRFMREVERFAGVFQGASKVLELGAGQAWGACIIKQRFPHLRVLASDISEHAVACCPSWERVFQVKLDGVFACRSYDIPLAAAAVDLVFCYASAHHFVAHRRTLNEIHRVLTPGGRCLYLFEPACTRLLYPLARWRVTRKRTEVREDVLIYPKLCRIAGDSGFTAQVDFRPVSEGRSLLEANYYFLLSKLPFLQRVLPTCANLVFTKAA